MAEANFEPTASVPSDVEPDGMLAYFLAIQTPNRDDPNWPLPSFDAKDWAEDFCRRFMISNRDGHKTAPVEDDVGLMLAWFANALMRGFDEAQLRAARAPSTPSTHPSHIMRSSDASTFDGVCTVCGARDLCAGVDENLAKACPGALQ